MSHPWAASSGSLVTVNGAATTSGGRSVPSLQMRVNCCRDWISVQSRAFFESRVKTVTLTSGCLDARTAITWDAAPVPQTRIRSLSSMRPDTMGEVLAAQPPGRYLSQSTPRVRAATWEFGPKRIPEGLTVTTLRSFTTRAILQEVFYQCHHN